MNPLLSRRSLLFAALGALPGVKAETRAAKYETPYKYGKLVLSASTDKTEFDARSVDCPFVFSHDGLFYMTYVGFDGMGYQTGLASSKDLVEWKKLGCILRRDPTSSITRFNVAMNWIVRENGLRTSGKLRKIQGRFLGVYHAYPNAGYESGPAVIGLCRSDDLMHWDVGEIILRSEDGAEWERGGLYKPCLVEDKGTYYLFYNAKNTEKRWREQTGVATSKDLKTWTRYAGNPIIPTGGEGSWDERFASDPAVLRDRKTWVYYYYSLDAKGKARDLLALGNDPFHADKVDKILIDAGPPGAVNSTYAHKPSVIYRDGVLYHFYCAVSGKYPNEVLGISVARSRPW
jgi:Glycosyl hydrolases family 43